MFKSFSLGIRSPVHAARCASVYQNNANQAQEDHLNDGSFLVSHVKLISNFSDFY